MKRPNVVGLFLVSAILTTCCQGLEADDKQNTTSSEPLPGLLETHKKVVVCYANVSASSRQGQGSFDIGSDLDCTLCTHVIYASSELDASGKIKPFVNFDRQWTPKLKKRCPHVKISMSVRQAPDSLTFSTIAASPNLIHQLNLSFNAFFLDYKTDFDGIDLDLNLNASDTTPNIKENLVTLVKVVRDSVPSDKILTAALSKDRAVIDNTYDVHALSEHLDLLHIKTFDYHSASDGKTGPNAALHTQDSKNSESVVATVKYFKSLRAPTNKLVVGLPMFGHSYTLRQQGGKKAMTFGSETSGSGLPGPYTSESGFLSYMEVCDEMKSDNSSWSVNWDDETQTSYAQKDQQWISYEDERSVEKKALYVINENLAGVMIWTIDLDDFRGECSKKDSGVSLNFPLLRKVHETMAKVTLDGPDDAASEGDDVDSFTLTTGIVAAILLSMLLASVLLCVRCRYSPSCPVFV